MITITSYQPAWPGEFRAAGGHLRAVLGELALRIDHIGSTAVPGLAAKDIIDIQVTVADLSPDVAQALDRAGYRRSSHTQDHLPPGSRGPAEDWTKWVYGPPAGQRRTNIHIRVAGRPNQRYPLLFRDYLRSNPAAAQAYAQVKTALAKYHPDDLQAYYDVKDPACDLIIAAAELWASAAAWQPGPSDI